MNKKVYAVQIAPEFQDSPLNMGDFPELWPGIYLTGNRDFHGYTTDEFKRIYNRFDGPRLFRALQLTTGKKYAVKILRGNSQSDWIECYYPADEYTNKELDILESEYFNLGTEWIIHDGDTAPNGPDEIEGYSLYCYDDPRREIALCADTTPENVVLWEFDGWTHTPRYKGGE